jgi:hypothetical protein
METTFFIGREIVLAGISAGGPIAFMTIPGLLFAQRRASYVNKFNIYLDRASYYTRIVKPT